MDLPEFLATSNIARYAVDARLPQHISIQNRVTLLLPVDFQFGTNTLLHQKPLNKPLLEKACNTLAPIIHKLIVKHPCPGTSSAFFVKAIRNVRSPSLVNIFLVMVSNTSQVALVYSYLFKKVRETTTAAASTELLMILLTYDFEKLLKIYIAIGMSLLYHIKYGIWNSIYYDYSLRRGEYAFQPKETYVTEASYTVG